MKGATYTALRFSARPRQKTCNQTHFQTHHPQDTTNNQTMLKNITHNEDACCAPLHKECPQHHERKGVPGGTPGTCGAIGERVQVILVWVRALCT
jgi:hypothetical protein